MKSESEGRMPKPGTTQLKIIEVDGDISALVLKFEIRSLNGHQINQMADKLVSWVTKFDKPDFNEVLNKSPGR